jgi:hypothetical protein
MLNHQNNRTFQFSTTNIFEAVLKLFPSQWNINDEGSSIFRTIYSSVSFTARLDLPFYDIATRFFWNENENRLLLPRLQKTSKAEENDSSKNYFGSDCQFVVERCRAIRTSLRLFAFLLD